MIISNLFGKKVIFSKSLFTYIKLSYFKILKIILSFSFSHKFFILFSFVLILKISFLEESTEVKALEQLRVYC